MKKSALLSVTMFLVFFIAPFVLADENGYQIMLKNYQVYEGEDSKATMTMVLMNKTGKKRIREVLFWSLERGDEDKSMMYFLEPPSDKGTSFLTWEHKEADDDQWLYLPVLKRVKRISAADKHKSFMGTDFSYNDLSPPHPDEFNHTILREDSCDGQACYVIESIHKTFTNDPAYVKKRKYQYAKQHSWIRKDNYLLVKALMYDKDGDPLKGFSASDIREIEGIWTAMIITMKNLKSGHQTILTLDSIHYNLGLTDNFFTTRELERAR